MSDLIGKYDALDALCNNCDKPEPICAHYPCIQYNAIQDLPAEDGYCFMAERIDNG